MQWTGKRKILMAVAALLVLTVVFVLIIMKAPDKITAGMFGIFVSAITATAGVYIEGNVRSKKYAPNGKGNEDPSGDDQEVR